MENTLNYRRRYKNSISTVSNLLSCLDISSSEYEDFKALAHSDRYKEFYVPKADGTSRHVHAPHKLVRKIQRRIVRRIFGSPKRNPWDKHRKKGGAIIWPEYIYGSVPNDHYNNTMISKDYVACASKHCGSQSVLKIDIKDFFDNITPELVFNVFNKLLKYPRAVANALVDICCHNNLLIQGALTSSYIASAVLFDVEPAIVQRLKSKGLSYTRLVDDITISSRNPEYDFSFSLELVRQMLYGKNLPLNETKTNIIRSSTTDILIHGLRISFKEPRLPSDEVSRIRASVKNLESLAKIADYRVSRDYRRSFNRCLGRVNKLKRLGHKQYISLQTRVLNILPLPSKMDITRLDSFIHKLEGWYANHKEEYWYRRLYHQAHYDLNILNRTFEHSSRRFRSRLNDIKPMCDD